MSGLMSGDGKRGFVLPRPSSTLRGRGRCAEGSPQALPQRPVPVYETLFERMKASGGPLPGATRVRKKALNSKRAVLEFSVRVWFSDMHDPHARALTPWAPPEG